MKPLGMKASFLVKRCPVKKEETWSCEIKGKEKGVAGDRLPPSRDGWMPASVLGINVGSKLSWVNGMPQSGNYIASGGGNIYMY